MGLPTFVMARRSAKNYTVEKYMKLLRIGFGNAVVASRVKQVTDLKSAGGRRWRQEADQTGKLIDATAGRHTRAMLVTDSGHIILSSMTPESLKEKLHELKGR